MDPANEAPQRRRPSRVVTILLVVVAIPALLFTACGATLFVSSLASGGFLLPGGGQLWGILVGLGCTLAGCAALYALYRVFRGA